MKHFGYRRNYQVAKFFDVTPQTLSGWIKSGEIPPKHLLKYSLEINGTKEIINFENSNEQDLNYNVSNIKEIVFKNIKTIIFIPILSVVLISGYTFYIAKPIYTSKSKVLPISDANSTTSSFSGFATQLGINIPLSIGGKVPWDEIYPEILKSSDMLESLFENVYITEKYGELKLENILIIENDLEKYTKAIQRNMMLNKLKSMIKVSKDRASPIVNINVLAFEPKFASELSKDLILNSSLRQRLLKTNRVKQKRLFIEERLNQVSLDMKKMERDLREFRENNRNLSSSPSLQMKVQEMGREVDLQNSLYVTLKTEYEKAKIDEIGRDEMVQQIDGPSIPTRLTSPKVAINLIMSIFFGIFLAIFIIYFKERYFYKN